MQKVFLNAQNQTLDFFMHSCTFSLCKLLEKRLFALHQNNCPENTAMKIYGRFWLFSWLYFQKILERNATASYNVIFFFLILNTLQFFWNRKKITKAMVLQRPDALWKELFLKITSFSRIRSIVGSYITWVFDLQLANLLKKYPFIICIVNNLIILHASVQELFEVWRKFSVEGIFIFILTWLKFSVFENVGGYGMIWKKISSFNSIFK